MGFPSISYFRYCIVCVHSFFHSFYHAMERYVAKTLCAFYVHRQIVSIPKDRIIAKLIRFQFIVLFTKLCKFELIEKKLKKIKCFCVEFPIEFDNLINMARAMASYPNHSISINFINTNSFVHLLSALMVVV